MSINLTQSLVYETDSQDSFKKVLTTLVGVMFKEKPSQYAQMFVTQRSDSFDDGKKWISNQKKWSKPNYLHICSIGDYKNGIREGDERFESYDRLIQRVMEHLKTADVNKFFEVCGSGFDFSFDEDDGSIGAGYRLKHRPSCGWDNLDLSLCHIYYGK